MRSKRKFPGLKKKKDQTEAQPGIGAFTTETAAEAAAPKKRRKVNDRFYKISRVWGLAYAVVFAMFVGALLFTNLLPGKYLFPILIASGLLTLAIFPTLYFKFFKVRRKQICMVLSAILAVVYLVAFGYLYKTNAFFSKVTDEDVQYEKYYVVVMRSSGISDVADLKGAAAALSDQGDMHYPEAEAELDKEVKVSYDNQENIEDVKSQLYSGKAKAALLADAHYQSISEQETNFKKQTKIIKTIKVKIDSMALANPVNVTKESFNILITGLDVKGNINVTSRSDVNMIVTVNPKTHKVLLTSIPRDYQIRLTEKNNATDKLTHTGIYGVKQTMESVEDLTGLEMNYYVKVNYTTVIRMINAVGGIDVVSDYTFSTHGQAAQYTFKKGKNHLNGAQALAFARERKSFQDGDVQRNRDQTKVMEALIKKFSSSETLLKKYSTILSQIQDYIQMNFTASEIRQIIKFQLVGGYSWDVAKQSLKGSDVLTTCYSSGSYQVYVMQPDEEGLQKAVAKINKFMEAKE